MASTSPSLVEKSVVLLFFPPTSCWVSAPAGRQWKKWWKKSVLKCRQRRGWFFQRRGHGGKNPRTGWDAQSMIDYREQRQGKQTKNVKIFLWNGKLKGKDVAWHPVCVVEATFTVARLMHGHMHIVDLKTREEDGSYSRKIPRGWTEQNDAEINIDCGSQQTLDCVRSQGPHSCRCKSSKVTV